MYSYQSENKHLQITTNTEEVPNKVKYGTSIKHQKDYCNFRMDS